ncbi:amidohydrolase family protein [Kordiimonas sp. SCSIO 12603]|uniref:amidohydrolase family protein n=1 Tax=Kordiimonas sp. SCSIO 12603 TaxID=2829596 RepID=UPI002103F7A4|nr:amidohydrolase family protein [Kordiimonas sp. SCSIO 12603]UTW57790.1 amidohydrolase family protein [Kordiimonas sp. SCSIO 12603]
MRLAFSLLASILLSVSAFADTLISNVTAITMKGDEVIEGAYVYIRGDRIEYIGNGRYDPKDASNLEIIDGTGKFLIPGLAEMHGHLPQGAANSQQAKDTLFLYLAGGVTTVRGMLGNPVQFEMRQMIKEGVLDGPTLYLAAPSLNGSTVSSPEQGAQLVERYKNEGWDLLKIHPGLTLKEYDSIAKKAHEVGIGFGGHVPADVGLIHALNKGQASIDHMDGFIQLAGGSDERLSDEQIRHVVEQYNNAFKSWIVPTQPLFNILIGGGDVIRLNRRFENKYVSPETRGNWHNRIKAINRRANSYIKDNRNRMLAELYKSGANIVLGSDAPQLYSVPGFSIWREIEALIKAGVTPEDMLVIGTRNAGDYFKGKDRFGTIQAGMRADLLLLDANPLENSKNLFKQAGVMAAGRWYSRADIDAKLADIAARNK